MRSFDKKKIAVLSAMLVMILCVGAINHRLSVQEDLSVSAGYEDYELSQLEHDGEVLVDSINVTALPGESGGSGDSQQPASGGGVKNRVLKTGDGKALTDIQTAQLVEHGIYPA